MKRVGRNMPLEPLAAKAWRVIAVDGEGYGHGDCGHNHATDLDAVRCEWSPDGWDDMLVCDLLVRQVRVERGPKRDDRRAWKARQMELGLA